MAHRSDWTTALLGRDKVRTAMSFGAGFALLLAFLLLSDIASSRGWMADWFARFPLVVLVVLIVGGAIAAGNAYWNDGVVLSWLLVFAPVFGWLWNAFVQEGNVFFDEAIVPLAWAVFTALVVGTIGYVTGRTAREVDIRDGYESSTCVIRTLVGDRSQVARWGVLAGGLFVITSSLIYMTRPFVQLPLKGVSLFELFFPTGVIAANILLGTAVIIGWSGLASWPAYRDAGLLVSWGVLFGPMFGAILTHFVMDGISGSGPLVDAGLAFVAALVFAVILGTVGFLLGTTLRRIQGSFPTEQHPRDPKRRVDDGGREQGKASDEPERRQQTVHGESQRQPQRE